MSTSCKVKRRQCWAIEGQNVWKILQSPFTGIHIIWQIVESHTFQENNYGWFFYRRHGMSSPTWGWMAALTGGVGAEVVTTAEDGWLEGRNTCSYRELMSGSASCSSLSTRRALELRRTGWPSSQCRGLVSNGKSVVLQCDKC